MLNNIILKSIFSIVFLILPLLLTACGGSSSTGSTVINNPPIINKTAKSKKAINIIAQYAQDGLKKPTVEDYNDAGVKGVLASNLRKINQEVRKLGNKDLLDTQEKIQKLVNKIIKKSPVVSHSTIHINEILASNTHINMDTDFYSFSDWVELYNDSNKVIDLAGYYLSDKKDKPKLWKIPKGTKITAKGYLLIWADKKDKKGKELHANFKLSQKGETVTLADKTGEIIDIVTFSKQVSDISVAKVNNKITYLIPSPSQKNTSSLVTNDRAKEPKFSFKSGFYSHVLSLELAQENQGEIFYTLDGSQPTKLSQQYIKALNIMQTTVVRAMSVEIGKPPSIVKSHTYFVNHQTTLPVVSLSTDEKFLFDDTIGIHTDGTNGVPLKQCNASEIVPFNYAQEWERPVYFEFFDEIHSAKFSFGANLSITGQCSRTFPKKSLSFELNKKYGTKSLKYKELYPQKGLSEIKDFKLRMGNKGYEIGDILATTIVGLSQMDVDYQAYRSVQMFMNGEYWGIYNIREKKGGEYIKSNYPEVGKLDIINKDTVKKGDIIDYNILRDFLSSHDFVIEANYQKLLTMIDEKSFIDYMAFMIYSGNIDWIGANHRSWKEKKVGAKWRWILDDIDYGFKHSDARDPDISINVNLFERLKNSDSNTNMVLLFNGLLENTAFQAKFKARLNNLLISAFSPASVLQQVDKIDNERKVYMHLEKPEWQITLTEYTQHIQDVRAFANARRDIVKAQLAVFLP